MNQWLIAVPRELLNTRHERLFFREAYMLLTDNGGNVRIWRMRNNRTITFHAFLSHKRQHSVRGGRVRIPGLSWLLQFRIAVNLLWLIIGRSLRMCGSTVHT